MSYREAGEVEPEPPVRKKWDFPIGGVLFIVFVLGITAYMLYVELTTPSKSPAPPPAPTCDCRCKCEVDCPDPPQQRPE